MDTTQPERRSPTLDQHEWRLVRKSDLQNLADAVGEWLGMPERDLPTEWERHLEALLDRVNKIL